jgi:hypothetical protein
VLNFVSYIAENGVNRRIYKFNKEGGKNRTLEKIA